VKTYSNNLVSLESDSSSTNVTAVLSLHIIFCLTISLLLPFASGFALDEQVTTNTLTFITTLSLCVFIWQWKRYSGRLFDPYVIFLSTVYVYHCGQYILYFFGDRTDLMSDTANVFRFSYNTRYTGQSITLIAMSYLHLGALISLTNKNISKKNNEDIVAGEQKNEPLKNAIETQAIGIAMIVISVIPFFMQLSKLISLRSVSGYMGLYQIEQDTGLGNWVAVFAQLIVPGALYLLAGSCKNRWRILLALGAVSLQVVGYSIIGLRSAAFPPILAFLWIYHRYIRRIPIAFAVLSVVAIAILLPLIAVIRTQKIGSGLDWQQITEAYSNIDNPLSSTLQESGYSTVVLLDTLEVVPEARSYALGGDYLNAIVSPFGFLLVGFMDDDDLNFNGGYLDPSKWIVQVRYPWRVHGGLWLGYTVIAEAYLQFGWLGVPILMLIIGYTICRLTLQADIMQDSALIAIVGIVVSYLPHFARGHVAQLTRPIFRYMLLPLLFIGILSIVRQAMLRRQKELEEELLVTESASN